MGSSPMHCVEMPPHRSREAADYYAYLGVRDDASAGEITHAYRRLAREWHPDKRAAGEAAEATARLAALNEAYTVLKDDERRCLKCTSLDQLLVHLNAHFKQHLNSVRP